MISQSDWPKLKPEALQIEIAAHMFSRLDTLTSQVANLTTAVQGIATSEGVMMGKVDDALALAVAQAPQMAALTAAVNALVNFVTVTAPAQQAAAVAAALADDETKAQGILDALNAEGTEIVADTTAATGALPGTPPPATGGTAAP